MSSSNLEKIVGVVIFLIGLGIIYKVFSTVTSGTPAPTDSIVALGVVMALILGGPLVIDGLALISGIDKYTSYALGFTGLIAILVGIYELASTALPLLLAILLAILILSILGSYHYRKKAAAPANPSSTADP